MSAGHAATADPVCSVSLSSLTGRSGLNPAFLPRASSHLFEAPRCTSLSSRALSQPCSPPDAKGDGIPRFPRPPCSRDATPGSTPGIGSRALGTTAGQEPTAPEPRPACQRGTRQLPRRRQTRPERRGRRRPSRATRRSTGSRRTGSSCTSFARSWRRASARTRRNPGEGTIGGLQPQ